MVSSTMYIAFALSFLLVTVRGNVDSCAEVDYGIDAPGCIPFYDETYWSEEFVSELCYGDGNAKKGFHSADLCDEFADNEDYKTSFKLAILNTMYGKAPIQPQSCAQWCMYDPLHVAGPDSVVFKWMNKRGCWKVITGSYSPLCNIRAVSEWSWAIEKSLSWCPGRICEAFGDPHIISFYSNSVEVEQAIGDYVLFSSDTLRVDVRLRPYVHSDGVTWSSVSGVHATAIEVIDGDCPVKIEIYNKHQTKSGEVVFLFNEEEISWDDLSDRLTTCDEICSDLNEVVKDNAKLSVTFTDKVVVTIQNVEDMQALFITAPLEAFATDDALLTDDQLCMEDYRRLNCDDDITIFTQYDFLHEQERFMLCGEVPADQSFDSSVGECHWSIKEDANNFCGDCDSCVIDSLVSSCVYDICASPSIIDAWRTNEQFAMLSGMNVIATEYCEFATDLVEDNPWICSDN